MTRTTRVLLSICLLGACGPRASAPSGGATGGAAIGVPDHAAGDGLPVTPTAPAADPVFPEEAFRATQPAATAARPLKVPAIQHFALDPLDVYLVEDHKLPTISVELNFDGGAMNDPRAKVGLASTCMSMLTEGTATLDEIAYNEALADLASSISASAGDDNQSVAMSSLTKSFEATFALYVDTLTKPGLRQDDFDRLIKRSLESLKQAKGSAVSVAGRLTGAVLYGKGHPFGQVATEATVKALKLADCKKYVTDYLKPKGARLFVVGDLTADQVKQTFAPLLAVWKGAPRKSVTLPRPAPPKGRIFFVDVKGSAQSSVSALTMGPMRKDKDYFANSMMASILGGGFTGRINMNLREDKGYSYGARAGFNYSKAYGTFSATTSVRSDATYQSMIEMVGEIGGLKDASKPATEAELAREKDGAILGLPARFATKGDILASYRTLVYFGLPFDYYDHYVDNMSAVTLAQAQAAAKKQLKPGELAFLVVGDGSAPQIQHVYTDTAKGDTAATTAKDVPLTAGKDGKQLTLRDALALLLKSGKVTKGSLVVLDADGNVTKP